MLPNGTLWDVSLPEVSSSFHPLSSPASVVDWSRYAYVQYVTKLDYLCNSVMLFESLSCLNSKADRLMMFPSEFKLDNSSAEGKLLHKARDRYGVQLVPIAVQSKPTNEATWAESYTKLFAFNQTQYDRVLSLDSDATVLQRPHSPSIDELFLLPPCPVAMPRAYWGNFDDRVLGSYIILIQPSEFEFNRVMQAIEKASDSECDMEIVNHLYRDSALILPHRPYGLLTGEFRLNHHTAYLGNDIEMWDPDQVFKEAKYLHFSDWPVPKPCLRAPEPIIQENQPIRHNDTVSGVKDCRSRDLWLGFYSDFGRRRGVWN
ncbi:nucleotide-diphospho-sugar transferase [Aspergillus pseudotamarii]|uniref:Nucleotide-diphospho-sugar transferase n=1 Tax=Aspergillus pseudotamarii TaxID=132259 RepID=A0A5N6T4J6_ASPPS|nr:nucleotide-diphospho-sugar transferase [Aspergillus pseudotamarii]KAE8141233.1 nucleotide-diphospho-sugar transferase [Aspergillus pseudotamarii]